IQTAALMWQVYDITGSPLPLAFLGIANFLPNFAMSFLGGALADTRDRRFVIAVAQVAPFSTSLLLAVLTATGTISLPLIYLAEAFTGLASAFDGPARGSLLPQVVPRTNFQRAVTASNVATQLAR